MLSYAPAVSDRAIERYEAGQGRDLDQRQLTQLGNAAWAAGMHLLMDDRLDESRDWLRTAARRYRESWDAGAPPDSWGRPIAAMKALLIAGDDAQEAAQWALDAGAREATSPIGIYAACLALLVLGEDAEARELADALRGRDDFPPAVAEALAGDPGAIEDILESFEQRDEFLEDVRVADTVLVFRQLARARGRDVELRPSPLLPGRATQS